MIRLKNTFLFSSFHKVTLESSIRELIETIGHPQLFENRGNDKVNVEWNCVTDCGIEFTIYDWKYYTVLGMDETVRFHIGGKNFVETHTALEKVLEEIKIIRNAGGILDDESLKAFNELKDIYTNED